MELTNELAFTATTLTAAVALFAVAIWMNASANTHTARKTLKIKRLTRQLETDCEELTARIAELQPDLRKLAAEEKALATENTQIRKSCAAALQDTFDVVHEVGSPSGGTARFDAEILLSPAAMQEGPAAAQNDPRVWALRNIAQVWAASPYDALQAAGRAFPARYGFVVSKFLNAQMPSEAMEP